MEKQSLRENNAYKKISINTNKDKDQSVEKMIYFLSDKKDNHYLTFIKTFLYNNSNNGLQNDISTKNIIKVNIDNRSKSKINIISSDNVNNIQTTKINKENLNLTEDISSSITEKINKCESRIDNLLGIINDFEQKFINSPETQRIKTNFEDIMNKKIYKNKITNDYMHKSWVKTEYNNDIFNNIEKRSILKDSCLMDIKNINISINNNNYENNYFITQSSQNKRIHHRTFNKKQNFSEKKFNIKISNNSVLKKCNFKTSKNKSKCISNDKNSKIIQNYGDKSKLFKLPIDFIINNKTNKNNIKNYRYNYSYKEFHRPLTDRKEKNINNKIIDNNNLKNKLKSANKKKNNCLMIKKIMNENDEQVSKPSIRKEGIKKSNLLNSKKNLFNKNFSPSSIQGNNIINNTINGGRANKDKNFVNYSNLNQIKEKGNIYINYTLNKKKLIKKNYVTAFLNNQQDIVDNKDSINRKNLCNKKK